MSKATSKAADFVSAAMVMGAGTGQMCTARGFYELECVGPDGKPKWKARSKNLVVNVGLKAMCDAFFAGVNYNAAWFIGLYGAALANNPAPDDTAAVHPGWVEVVPYSNAVRPTAAFAPASASSPAIITNAAAPALFNIDAVGVVGGAFLISDSAKMASAGILFSASDLQAPGDRGVSPGDIINATYRFELTAT
jgi:hypothetical protein